MVQAIAPLVTLEFVVCIGFLLMNLSTSVFVIGGCSLAIGIIASVSVLNHRDLHLQQPSAQETLAPEVSSIQRPTVEHLKIAWIVTPSEAIALIEDGATVLDARGKSSQLVGTLSGALDGAIAVSWQQFAQDQAPNRGKLLTNPVQLSQRLQDVGVFHHRAVVVLGDPRQGWGEDGRIVWMLRTLGHDQAVLVDGGYPAVAAAGISHRLMTRSATAPKGDFVVQHTPDWDADREAVQAAIDQPDVVILDVRELREFDGNTPYGESRGGHIPGAIHLYFKDLLDETGAMLPPDQLLTLLRDRGITRDHTIISYCTGGIRSGWMTSVLTTLGFDAKNYAGSMWEWSALSPEHYPLMN